MDLTIPMVRVNLTQEEKKSPVNLINPFLSNSQLNSTEWNDRQYVLFLFPVCQLLSLPFSVFLCQPGGLIRESSWGQRDLADLLAPQTSFIFHRLMGLAWQLRMGTKRQVVDRQVGKVVYVQFSTQGE